MNRLKILRTSLFGILKISAIQHSCSWMFYSSKGFVRNVLSTKILAASEDMDETKTTVHVFRPFLSVQVDVLVCFGSPHLFTSLFYQKDSIQTSIRSGFAGSRHELYVGSVDYMPSVCVKMILENVPINHAGSLTETIQLALFTRILQIDFQCTIEIIDRE